MLHGLDLFSGIGGLTLALAPWIKPQAYYESERYAQALLLSRMRSGQLPTAPIWDDVRTLSKEAIKCRIQIIYGGFPCQDISVAGTGKGLAGERSGLFFEILRLIDELRPELLFLENVPAIRTRGAERVGKELASRGYDCRWDVISAQDVGAPHLRKRWFLLAAHANCLRELQQAGPVSKFRDGVGELRSLVSDSQQQQLWDEQGGSSGTNGQGEALARNNGSQESLAGEGGSPQGHPFDSGWWATEPNVGRVANGIPTRVDRIRGLGNAVVPLQAREAFKRLMGLKEAA